MSERESMWTLFGFVVLAVLVDCGMQIRHSLPLGVFGITLFFCVLLAGFAWILLLAACWRYESSDSPRRGPEWYREGLREIERRP